MNALNTTDRNAQTRTDANVVPITAGTSRRYRERSFGIGYGSSSGYAFDKRYTSDWGQILFRCA
ncbi:MAG: hypothetical protein E6Q88_01185 [Lysobacteraceae bacterium]|nr:MAG: hypothetical protein E6Q88_01185 [Xanthomonadaceae bacterium]